MKNKVFLILFLTLAVIVMILSFVYMFTDWMIPGLLPFSQALLMIPIVLTWNRTQQKSRWIPALFAVAALLNVIAGIMQLVMK